MTVDLSGTLGWNAATGTTSWDIHETMAMTMTQDGDTITMNATADLGGSMTVTASTIVADTSSSVTVHANYMVSPSTRASGRRSRPVHGRARHDLIAGRRQARRPSPSSAELGPAQCCRPRIRSPSARDARASRYRSSRRWKQ